LPLSSKPTLNTGVSMRRPIGVAAVWARPRIEEAKPPVMTIADAVADDLRNVRRLMCSSVREIRRHKNK
jgi:hypothetical protein